MFFDDEKENVEVAAEGASSDASEGEGKAEGEAAEGAEGEAAAE